MKTILLPIPVPTRVIKRAHLRARAVHRLARTKRWPAYVFAAAIQEMPHDVHDNLPATVAVRAVHMYLLYLSFTLIE